jgi:hypothetical protein
LRSAINALGLLLANNDFLAISSSSLSTLSIWARNQWWACYTTWSECQICTQDAWNQPKKKMWIDLLLILF